MRHAFDANASRRGSAIFLHSVMPPAAQTSGCTMSIALRTMASRKPQRVNSFSPPATAMSSARDTST